MTLPTNAKPEPRQPSSEVLALLQRAGISETAINATMAIDAVLQTWRRQVQKRELGQHALADLGIELDLAQFDVLVAIDAPRIEFGDAAGEAMVATVAERLSIDPSRASRLVSELVAAGYAARAASQQDARRTIVELTPLGRSVLEAVRGYKWLIMGTFLADWTAEEMETFIPLLQRFSQWGTEIGARKGRFAGEIESLAEGLATAREKTSRRNAG